MNDVTNVISGIGPLSWPTARRLMQQLAEVLQKNAPVETTERRAHFVIGPVTLDMELFEQERLDCYGGVQPRGLYDALALVLGHYFTETSDGIVSLESVEGSPLYGTCYYDGIKVSRMITNSICGPFRPCGYPRGPLRDIVTGALLRRDTHDYGYVLRLNQLQDDTLQILLEHLAWRITIELKPVPDTTLRTVVHPEAFALSLSFNTMQQLSGTLRRLWNRNVTLRCLGNRLSVTPTATAETPEDSAREKRFPVSRYTRVFDDIRVSARQLDEALPVQLLGQNRLKLATCGLNGGTDDMCLYLCEEHGRHSPHAWYEMLAAVPELQDPQKEDAA